MQITLANNVLHFKIIYKQGLKHYRMNKQIHACVPLVGS